MSLAFLALGFFFPLAFALLARSGENNRLRVTWVRHWAAEYGVDPALVQAVIECESGGRASAVSRAGAVGLMQVMPGTAAAVAAEMGLPAPSLPDLHDPEINIRLGVYYLAKMRRRFKDDQLALAAYNAGPTHVQRWMDRYPTSDGATVVRLAAFQETKAYVRRVLRAWNERKISPDSADSRGRGIP
ncbi:MAG: lytic transglycosylase domain-containing protein [Planctomycetota bacterium]|jgi:soluble lytic murein transglycosylase